MSDGFDEDAPRQWLGLTRMRAGIFAAVAVIAIFYLFGPKPVPFVNPKIAAEPFVWPTNCEKKTYKELTEINKSCLSWYIGDGSEWGWPRGPKSADYYRISNDAIRISCNRGPNMCWIQYIIHDAFVNNEGAR
jgi:hypothetical protein